MLGRGETKDANMMQVPDSVIAHQMVYQTLSTSPEMAAHSVCTTQAATVAVRSADEFTDAATCELVGNPECPHVCWQCSFQLLRCISWSVC